MTEFNELFENEFFYIDSYNLNEIEEKMYGYAIANNKIVFDSIDNAYLLDGTGAYVYVQVDEDKITIFQDFNGSYGIYYYKTENFFAISNSFLKLVETLKEKHNLDNNLTLNKEYADAFLFADLCSYAYEETLVNEITVLPRNYIININKTNKKVSFDEIDYEEQTIPITSKESFEILDNWYNKWVNIIRSIKAKTNNLSIDLSGGFDSRVVSVLWLTANIDLEKVRIKTHIDEKDVHAIDYKIASQIAEEFNFKLNNSSFSYETKKFQEIETPLNISFYTKLSFHKQMYFKYSQASEKVYTITGEGGECIREYLNQTPQEYIENIKKLCNKYDPSLTNSTIAIIERSLEKIRKRFNLEENSKKIIDIHYKEVRSRHHFGKAAIESMFSNWITLTPLIDKDLRKLDLNTDDCLDQSLLLALIYIRYCPKLLNFEFEGNRSINPETINFAKKLNETIPLKKKTCEFISGPLVKKTSNIPENGVTHSDIENYLKNVFISKSFEFDFEKYFSKETYQLIIELFEKENFHPLKNIYSSLAIILIINFIHFNTTKELVTSFNWIDNLLYENKEIYFKNEDKYFDESLLLKYATARLDIKNIGDADNSVKIIEASSTPYNIKYPEWFNKDDGTGITLTSHHGSINLTIKCIKEGTLKIWLRSLDIKSKNGARFPIYIDYIQFKVNNIDCINKNKLICHDQPFVYSKEVANDEIINIQVKWKPFNENSEFSP